VKPPRIKYCRLCRCIFFTCTATCTFRWHTEDDINLGGIACNLPANYCPQCGRNLKDKNFYPCIAMTFPEDELKEGADVPK